MSLFSLFVNHAGDPVRIEEFDKIPFGQGLPSEFDDGEPVKEPRPLNRTHSFVGKLASAHASAPDPVLPIKPKPKQPKSWDAWDAAPILDRKRKVDLPPKTLYFSKVSQWCRILDEPKLLGTQLIFISDVRKIKTKTGEKDLTEPGDRAEDP